MFQSPLLKRSRNSTYKTKYDRDFPDTKNKLLIHANKGSQLPRIPVWIHGRYLPEECTVRDLNEYFRVSQDPELSAKATVIPAIKYEGKVDGVAMFYDPMMIPQAMGLTVELSAYGPVLKNPIREPEDLRRLPPKEFDADAKFSYIMESIVKARTLLDGRAILVGIIEGPYTIFCTMLEGRACRKSAIAEEWLRNRRVHSHVLLQRIVNFQAGLMWDQQRMGCQSLHVHEPNAEELPKDLFDQYIYPFMIQLLVGAKSRLDDIGYKSQISVFVGTNHYVFDRLCYTDAELIQTPAWYDAKEKREISRGKVLLAYFNLSQLTGSNRQEINKKIENMLTEYTTNKLVAHIYHDIDTDTDPEAVEMFLDSIREISAEKMKESACELDPRDANNMMYYFY
ncbi:hypothetical protein HDV01_001044 [Terramyces sp. JEL0728]|nr:hypothetical protein HDV01_001044 [Terramyces sp. JEL0728]